MTIPRIVREGSDPIAEFAFNGSIAVPDYALMFQDTDDVKPASSQSDAGTEAGNQETFASNFAGLANKAMLTTDEADSRFPILVDAQADFDCVSTTWEVGDYIAACEQSNGTQLENQKVKKTTDPAAAIGRCVRRSGSATTTVRGRFVSRVLRPLFSGTPTDVDGTSAETFQVANDSGKPRAALGHQSGGTGNFKALYNAPATLTGDRTYTGPADSDQTLVGATATQTLTNKTLTAPVTTEAVEHSVAGKTITAAMSGRTFTNEDDDGANVYALPPAVEGLWYRFYVLAAFAMRIDPDGTETISGTNGAQGAAGKYLEADAVGEFAEVHCFTDGQWEVAANRGTWTHEG